MKVGRVGIKTGAEGDDDRLRWGKVGEMGDDCGVRLLTYVDMGVFAMKSPSLSDSFSGRLPLLPMLRAEDRRPTVRLERLGKGDEDNAYVSCVR